MQVLPTARMTEHILIVRGLRASGASVPLHPPKRREVSDIVSLSTNKKATVSGGLLSSLPTSSLGYGFNRGWR